MGYMKYFVTRCTCVWLRSVRADAKVQAGVFGQQNKTGVSFSSAILMHTSGHMTGEDPSGQQKTLPPLSFRSICKKRKLGQRADRLCGRWFCIVVRFVQAGASPFHESHKRVTPLWPTVSCTEEIYQLCPQRWPLEVSRKKKKMALNFIKFDYHVGVWVHPPQYTI